MVTGLVFMLLGAAAVPCEGLQSVKLDKATITSATLVPEGPAPARGGGARPAERAEALAVVAALAAQPAAVPVAQTRSPAGHRRRRPRHSRAPPSLRTAACSWC